MMKRQFYIIGTLLILLLFCACSRPLSAEEEVRNFYMEYVDAVKKDRVNAATEYVHFEDENWLKLTQENANNTLSCTDILSIKRLSNDLWVIHIYYESVYVPDGNTAYHFVGAIDGDYKVMRHPEDIPPALAQDLNLEEYMPTGEFISPDDVIQEDDIK